MRILVAAFLIVLHASLPAAGSDQTLLTFRYENNVVELGLTDLQDLGQTEIMTTTIWTEGKQNFTGVALSDFLEAFGVTEGELIATAINDYEISIPASDAVEGGPIIAYFRNGEPMSVRDKGPLWIVYPFDSHVRYQSEVIYSRSIWQLDRLRAIE